MLNLFLTIKALKFKEIVIFIAAFLFENIITYFNNHLIFTKISSLSSFGKKVL